MNWPTTSIGDNSTAIRSPLLTIQTILFRDSSREAGLRPQILVTTTGQIINHYQNFSYSNGITHAKQKTNISTCIETNRSYLYIKRLVLQYR